VSQRIEYWVMRREDIERHRGGLVVDIDMIPRVAVGESVGEAEQEFATFAKLNPEISGSYTITKVTMEEI
jgi:hypothetical protein